MEREGGVLSSCASYGIRISAIQPNKLSGVDVHFRADNDNEKDIDFNNDKSNHT